MKVRRWIWVIGAGGFLVAGALLWWLVAGPGSSATENTGGHALVPLDPKQVDIGRTLYQANCAQCHGVNAEGDPNWRQSNPDGTFLPPPHDSTGHTWHHGDGLLFRYVRDGGKIYENPAFKSMMPPFGDRLIDEEIRSVITYLKSLWGPSERAAQADASREDLFP